MRNKKKRVKTDSLFRRKEFIMKKSLLVFIKNWWYTIPLILFLLMIAGSALVNDLCGGCVSKRGNIFYNVHDKS